MPELKESLSWLESVIKELREQDGDWLRFVGVVPGPSGANQHTQSALFDEEWIDQRTSCGDDYYGEIYIRKGDVWIQFSFSC